MVSFVTPPPVGPQSSVSFFAIADMGQVRQSGKGLVLGLFIYEPNPEA